MLHKYARRPKSTVLLPMTLIRSLVIFLSFPICRSVARLLLSINFQNDAGTLVHRTHVAN